MGVAVPAGSPEPDVVAEAGAAVEDAADEVPGVGGWAGGVGVHEVSKKLIPNPVPSTAIARWLIKVCS